MLLEQTLRRIALLVSLDRTVAIVALAHERFYASSWPTSRRDAWQFSRRVGTPPAIPLRSAPAHHNGPRSGCKSGSHCRSTYCENEEGDRKSTRLNSSHGYIS